MKIEGLLIIIFIKIVSYIIFNVEQFDSQAFFQLNIMASVMLITALGQILDSLNPEIIHSKLGQFLDSLNPDIIHSRLGQFLDRSILRT